MAMTRAGVAKHIGIVLFSQVEEPALWASLLPQRNRYHARRRNTPELKMRLFR